MSTDQPLGQRTLDVHGVVDFMSAPEVQQKAVDVLADEALEQLVIDLSGITFIDSSGLSVLVYLKGRCDERGIGLVLRDVPQRARTLIDSLGLSTYFEI